MSTESQDNKLLADLNNEITKKTIVVKKDTKVKSEDTIVNNTLNFLMANHQAPEILKDFAIERLNCQKFVNPFPIYKKDLDDIIKAKKLKILLHTSIVPNAHRGGDMNYLELHYSIKFGKDNLSRNVTSYFCLEEFNEEFYYFIFKKCIYILLLVSNQRFNKMEMKELEKLSKKAISILDTVYDLNHPSYLVSADIFTSLKNAQQFLDLDNSFVKEYIERRKKYIMFDFAQGFEDDFDYIIINKKLIIPIVFKLTTDASCSKLSFSRKYNKKLVNKYYTININSLDVFQLYKILNSIFEWMESYLEILQIEHLRDKFILAKNVINHFQNDDDDENEVNSVDQD